MSLGLMTINTTLEKLLEQIKSGSFHSVGYAGNDEFLCWMGSSANYYALDEIATPAVIRAVKLACPVYTSFSIHDKGRAKVVEAAAAATRWRIDNGYTGRGGVVVVHEGTAQSWCAQLPDPNDWSRGCLAVDELGDKAWIVSGDEDQDFSLWASVDGHK